MNNTAQQIEYAASLESTIQQWIGEWKAMLPTTPQGAAIVARIEAAMVWLSKQDAGTQIDLLKVGTERKSLVGNVQYKNLTIEQDHAMAAGSVLKAIEGRMAR